MQVWNGSQNDSRKKYGFTTLLYLKLVLGVYDRIRIVGWMNVGINHDTVEFAVASIRGWW